LAARERFGIGFRHVEGDELTALQPGPPRFVKGTFVPGWKTADDPKLLGKAVWAYAERLGARFEKARQACRCEAGWRDFDAGRWHDKAGKTPRHRRRGLVTPAG
jgi:D-amino-acid dehydrogenase